MIRSTERVERCIKSLEAVRQIESNDGGNAPEMKDSIPEIYSQAYLQHRIKSGCKAFIGRRRPFAVAIVDIDHFKEFNDMHGSDEGNRLLNKLISLLKSYLFRGELLSSYGGDSFILILNESHIGNCSWRADSIRRSFMEKFQAESGPLTLSIGAAFYPSAGRFEMELVNCARAALHASKRRGGNCVTLIPSLPPDVPLPPKPGPPSPSYVDPPGRTPAISSGYEQQIPDDEISE